MSEWSDGYEVGRKDGKPNPVALVGILLQCITLGLIFGLILAWFA